MNWLCYIVASYTTAVGAASQWWSNERMRVYFKMVRCSLMLVKCSLIMGRCSLMSISPSLTRILPSLAWSKPPFAHLTIIEKLHRLYWLAKENIVRTAHWFQIEWYFVLGFILRIFPWTFWNLIDRSINKRQREKMSRLAFVQTLEPLHFSYSLLNNNM